MTVGPPARWASTSNVEGGSGKEQEAQGPLPREEGLYSDILFAWVPEFLVTPLPLGLVCLTTQGQSEKLVRPWTSPITSGVRCPDIRPDICSLGHSAPRTFAPPLTGDLVINNN